MVRNEIVRDLESWVTAMQKSEILQDSSNVVIISGYSKTADIALELVMGMHGPQELHLVLINPEMIGSDSIQ